MIIIIQVHHQLFASLAWLTIVARYSLRLFLSHHSFATSHSTYKGFISKSSPEVVVYHNPYLRYCTGRRGPDKAWC
ncbi:hypothetical protein BDD12DRAFT_867318 [Trichophaea hybrida]|nr:hypothetical protein BDD12DRAFT_867318 [Trichophaea hybrida]